MKNLRFLFFFACLIVAFSVNAQERKQLVILHTNDTHSTIIPIKETVADTLLAGRGGAVRRACLVDMERKKSPDLLLFDSGDFSQGSPYYTMFGGAVEVGVMNTMGYDATTLGNHEFDNGIDNLARLIKMSNFPYVCSNYDFSGSVLEGLVKPWITINRSGIKIGVFGLAPVLSGIVMEGAINGIKPLDTVKAAQETADYLRNVEKCDLVICLSHVGTYGLRTLTTVIYSMLHAMLTWCLVDIPIHSWRDLNISLTWTVRRYPLTRMVIRVLLWEK